MSENKTPDSAFSVCGSVTKNDASEGELSEHKHTFTEHKGKLAMGVAAMLGVMVYYKWRERQLAIDDPEDYARLQRLKAGVHASDPDGARHEEDD